MSWILNLLYLTLLAILSPWLAYTAATTGKYRRGMLRKVLGDASHPLLSNRWPGPTVWLHGVSVGEIHLLRHVVAACKLRHPTWRLVVSTTTDTGYDEAIRSFPDLPVIWFPLDFSWAVTRAISQVKPDLIVLGESELWPNFLSQAKRRGVPVAVINARMSPRSAARFEKFAWLTGRLFRDVSLFAAQTEEYAERYRRLGARGVVMTGSVKYDGATADRANAKTLALAELLKIDQRLAPLSPCGRGAGGEGSRHNPHSTIPETSSVPMSGQSLPLTPNPSPARGEGNQTTPLSPIGAGDQAGNRQLVFVAGSTQSPEEEVCLAIFHTARKQHPNLRLILVPRHKERFDEVADLLIRSKTPFARRSQLNSPTDAPIVLVDTIGELGAIWGLADVAYVGGSLDGARGGQNMIEPAAYGVAVLFGPHTWNFKETVARLLEHRAAIQIADAGELEREVLRLLTDATERDRLGKNAQAFVRSQQGATARTLDAIETLLPDRKAAAA